MTENRGQRSEVRGQMARETPYRARPPFALRLQPYALHLIPYTLYLLPRLFWKRSAASYQPPETRNQRPATSNAFTLLEVMVAMAIMAIVLVSVYRMHSQTLAMNTANRFYTQAPLLAQSKLAQLESDASEIIAGDSGDFGDKFPGYNWNVSVEEVAIEALGEVANDFKRIDLTVSFNGNEYVYSVRTYRLFRE